MATGTPPWPPRRAPVRPRRARPAPVDLPTTTPGSHRPLHARSSMTHRLPAMRIRSSSVVSTGQYKGMAAQTGHIPAGLPYKWPSNLPYNLPLNLLCNLPPPTRPGGRNRRAGWVVKGNRTRRLLPCDTPCRTDRQQVAPSVASCVLPWAASCVPTSVASWVAPVSSRIPADPQLSASIPDDPARRLLPWAALGAPAPCRGPPVGARPGARARPEVHRLARARHARLGPGRSGRPRR